MPLGILDAIAAMPVLGIGGFFQNLAAGLGLATGPVSVIISEEVTH